MAFGSGRTVSLSLGRRIVGDFLAISKAIPLVTIQKEMDVAAAAATRQRLTDRPSWSAIMSKAYAQVVAARADLRRAYCHFSTNGCLSTPRSRPKSSASR